MHILKLYHHVKNNPNCVPLEFAQIEVESSRFKRDLQALYAEAGFDRTEVFRESLPEETKDLVKEMFEFQLKTGGIEDIFLYMDRFDILYEQGKMEHLIYPYIDTNIREVESVETELAFRLAGRYINIQETSEGQITQFTI